MRIFQVLEKNRFDTGSVQQMFQAAAGLSARGHDVTVVSRRGERLERECMAHGVRYRPVAMRHQFDIVSMIHMRRLIEELKPDVIHVHKGIAHAIALAATMNKPLGAFIVNRGVSFPLDFWNRAKYRTRRVDRVVTVCRQIKDELIRSGRLPSEKIEVVYAGTDIHQFDPSRHDGRQFRREKSIPDDRFVIAQVGIRDWKGWRELIDAVAAIAPEHQQLHLLLIGYQNEEAAGRVREYARECGIAGRVSPVEYRSDMPNVFAACDLVVDASWGGTGITGTVREAMAMAKPVIATNTGGNAELVSSPDVGWLIPARDHGALVNALRAVIENRQRAREVGAAAREHVVAKFSKELRIDRLESLYSEIVALKSAR